MSTNDEVYSGTGGPLVSVVIPTFNSSLTLSMCLGSLEAQTYKETEVLIVDNYSQDDTVNLASKFQAEVIELQESRTKARNQGARAARGSYILSIDSDMILPQGTVDECVRICRDKGVGAVILPEISVGEGYLSACRALQKRVFMEEQGYESARFFTREAFQKVNGYDEHLEAGEDFDIHFRMQNAGIRVSRSTTMVQHYEGRLSISKIIKKARYYGRTIDDYATKNWRHIERQPFIARVYVRKWRTLLRSIHLLPGLLLIVLVEFVFAGRHSRRYGRRSSG